MRSFSPSTAAKLSFVWAMGYLSLMHVHRVYAHYLEGGADWTAGQMMLTIKLVSLAYSYNDGFSPSTALLDEWKPMIVKTLPTPLEFFSFTFYFGSVLAGPPVWYNDYIRFITREAFPNKGTIPNTLFPVARRLATFVVTIACFFVVSEAFPINFATTAEYATRPVWYWVVYMYIAGSAMRFQYYSVFAMAEVASDACGLSYNGLAADGSERWDRVNMMNPLGVEV